MMGSPAAEGLGEDKAGLGERSLRGVHEEHGAVCHGKGPFHLAAEVGVARGVDDVDLDPVPLHGAVLGRDGDAPFPLQVEAVHDPLAHLLPLAVHSALPEQ
jgi:hypothetical protein